MKKVLKLFLCTLMCTAVILSCMLISCAASLGKVNKLSVSKVTASTVSLKWKKVSGATGYRVYRYSSSKEKYVFIGKTKKLKYTDDSLSAAKTYKYKVRAYKSKKGKDDYGAYSSVVKAKTNPKQVKKLKASSVTTSSLKLSWAKTSGAKAYEVFIYDSAKKAYISEGTTKKTSFTVKSLRPGTKYKFRVAAYYTSNDVKKYGTRSSALSVTTKLGTVSGITVNDITSKSYTLKWKKVSGATEYQIRKYSSEYKEWLDFATTKKNTYTVKGLSYGKSAKYQIRAVNDLTEGKYSKSVTAMTLAKAPTNLKATTDTKTVTLTWEASSKSTGYEIERYNTANGTWVLAGTSVNPTFADISLSKVGTYIYRVRGYTQSGDNKFYTEYSETADIFFESTVESGSIYNEELSASGVVGYLYDPNENCFYTADDPWQRSVGYNEIFDVASPVALIDFDTVRLKFDYNDKDWMIQIWKGQYGLAFYGAEIGVYNKPKDRNLKHYDAVSDNERLKMSMDFYEYKDRLFGNDGWEKKFSRPYASYWWCTGFIPGNVGGDFGSLRVDARITAKDYTMLSGITKALRENSIQYTTSGLNVYFEYH